MIFEIPRNELIPLKSILENVIEVLWNPALFLLNVDLPNLPFIFFKFLDEWAQQLKVRFPLPSIYLFESFERRFPSDVVDFFYAQLLAFCLESRDLW